MPIALCLSIWKSNQSGQRNDPFLTVGGRVDHPAVLHSLRPGFLANGDLDLYSMNPDGSDVVQLTDRPGYDGGAFYSPDGSQIIWRAHYPEEGPELDDYLNLLGEGLGIR